VAKRDEIGIAHLVVDKVSLPGMADMVESSDHTRTVAGKHLYCRKVVIDFLEGIATTTTRRNGSRIIRKLLKLLTSTGIRGLRKPLASLAPGNVEAVRNVNSELIMN